MPRDVDALITELLAGPVTAGQLREGAPHNAGLSTADAERVRAHLLASFETRGIPEDARDIVAEELRTSASPIVLAGAARAVRGLGVGAGDEWAPLLRDAAERVATADVFVRWQPGVVAPTWMRTVRGELLAVLEEVGEGSGTRTESAGTAPALVLDRATLRQVRLEDQAGVESTMADLLAGRPTVLAFFYTRCMNPARCSLTITRLAGLARSGDESRNVVAMTYDPGYDSPSGCAATAPTAGSRSASTPGWCGRRKDGPTCGTCSGLRVGYGPVTVNEHARELYMVGDDFVARALDPDALSVAAPGA